MENSNLISLLRTFTKSEMKEFDKFLRSPYFTEGKGLRHRIIYDYFVSLKEFYPEFTGKTFSKKYLYLKLYPNTGYNDAVMRRLNSDLTALAEKFLVQTELEKDEFKRKEYLINNLSPRKLDKAFLKKAAECYKFLDGERLNLYYHYNKQLTDILVNNFCVYRQELLSDYDLQKEADNFFLYFLSRALEIYRNMAIDESLFNVKFRHHFINEVVNYIKANQAILEENPLVAIHYYELMVNLNSSETNYTKLKLLKNNYADKLDVSGRYNIYINLSSFCYRMIREGQIAYRKELLHIDIEILEKEVYHFSDYISYSNFHSMIRNAAIIKEFSWAYKFISAYQDRLDPKHKDFAVNYANADICFEQKHYNKALEYLSKISIEYDYEKQRIKNMILKIYYETASFENAYSAIDSNRHFLRNDNHIPGARKKSFLNFLAYTLNLINIKLNPDEIKIKQLKQKIQRSEYFVNKDWLLEKAEELSISKKNFISG